MHPVVALLIVTSGLLASCSKWTKTPGKRVEIGAVCREPDRARVRVTGYLRYRRGSTSHCTPPGKGQTCELELREDGARPEAAASPGTLAPVAVGLSVRVGDEPAEMSPLSASPQPWDVALHLKSGANATDGSHITIDGTVRLAPPDGRPSSAPSRCSIQVDWVEAGWG